MRVRLLTDIEGWVRGVFHPQAGMELDLAPVDAKRLLETKQAEVVREKASEIETAEVGPSENAAKRTGPPTVRRTKKRGGSE